MKKIVVSFILILAFAASLYSQDFDSHMQKGKDLYYKGDYFTALDSFYVAYDIADTDSTENDAIYWKNKSIEKIKQQIADYKNDKLKAEQDLKNEKIKSETTFKHILNATETWINAGKKLYELAKFKGVEHFKKGNYYDAYYYLKLAKLSPDYTSDTEVEDYFTKSKTELGAIKKIALVIGNANYVEANLDKAITDAKDVTAALESMGFEVITGYNQKSAEFDGLFKQFYEKGQNCDIALFFYTGFGYQSDYMLPVDTKTDASGNLKSWFSLNYLMDAFPKNFKTKKIFILDMDRTSKDAFIPAVMAYRNTMVVFSATPNNKAFNGVGRNSLFTEQFLKYLKMSNTSFQDIFCLIHDATKKASKDRQVPTLYDNIQDKVYLNWKVE
jgi:hypothetical protein